MPTSASEVPFNVEKFSQHLARGSAKLPFPARTEYANHMPMELVDRFWLYFQPRNMLKLRIKLVSRAGIEPATT